MVGRSWVARLGIASSVALIVALLAGCADPTHHPRVASYHPPAPRPALTRSEAVKHCSRVAAQGVSRSVGTGGTIVIAALSQGHLVYFGVPGRLLTGDAERAQMFRDIGVYQGCARFTTVPAGRYTFELGRHYVDPTYTGPARTFGRPTANRYFPKVVTVVLTKQKPNATVVVELQPAPVLRGMDDKPGWVYTFDAAGKVVRASPVSRDGSFRVGGLRPGRYRLVAVSPDESPFKTVSAVSSYDSRIVVIQPTTQDRVEQTIAKPFAPSKALSELVRQKIEAYQRGFKG
jgi:hypothetical protein